MSKKKETERKGEKKEIIKTNLDIFPIRNYDGEVDGFVLEDGSYLNLFEVVSKDRKNAQQDDVQFDMISQMRFYRLYQADIKWLALNFPVNTSLQRKNKAKKLDLTNDPVRRKWLKRQIEDLQLLDHNVARREYFLMYFANDKDDFAKKTTTILGHIGQGKSRIVEPISKEKRAYIFYKLNNMNSLIVVEEQTDEKEI